MTFEIQKLKDVIEVIASHLSVDNLGPTKLYKLTYFADVQHLRATGSSITGSEYIKYQHGPVPSRAERALKQLLNEHVLRTESTTVGDFQLTKIIPIILRPPTLLSPAELNTLESVCLEFGKLSAGELSELSHREPAWIGAESKQKLSTELMHYGAKEDPDGL
ncbi:MAG: Panacea domain-containing protein [Planctomycetota bacterium]